MTAFVIWYLGQTALSIGALCLFCVGCGASILVAGVGATRLGLLLYVSPASLGPARRRRACTAAVPVTPYL